MEAEGVLLMWGLRATAELEELSAQRSRETLCEVHGVLRLVRRLGMVVALCGAHAFAMCLEGAGRTSVNLS